MMEALFNGLIKPIEGKYDKENQQIKDKYSTPEALAKKHSVLGLTNTPTTEYVCFLPFLGEMGWNLQVYSKRIHGYNHNKIIACIKPGHEALCPRATLFYYDWQDLKDEQKAGPGYLEDLNIKENILKQFHLNENQVTFLPSEDSGWDEKLSLADINFIPRAKNNFNLETDVVITPRNRKVDSHRNWSQENWQELTNQLIDNGYRVGLCGHPDSSFDIKGVSYRSWDYIDVDSDIELMTKTRLVVTQESGLLYLAFLCNKNIVVIDYYMGNMGSDLHRPVDTKLYELAHLWFEPKQMAQVVISILG